MTGELRSLLNPRLQPPRTVADWLEVATADLTPTAAARVRADYQTHLEDTLAAEPDLTEAGLLRRWGSARAARTGLNRAHLTTWDARHLPPGRLSVRRVLLDSAPMQLGMLGAAGPEALRGDPRALTLLGAALLLVQLINLARWQLLTRPLRPESRVIWHWLTKPSSIILLGGLLWATWTGVTQPAQVGGWFDRLEGWLAAGVLTVQLVRFQLSLTAARKQRSVPV